MGTPDPLASQLAEVFSAGLRADPSLRDSLAEALARSDGSGPDGELTKSEVNYRRADGKEECGRCAHYSAGRCDIVSGTIDAAYVCDKYDGGDEGSSTDTGE